MIRLSRLIRILILMQLFLSQVNGHAKLVNPPSRNYMWRDGFKTPPYYNDNGLNCGGTSHQWGPMNGKCGPCGDAWDSPTPRKFERGGSFANGPIVRSYTEGSQIDIGVSITANHAGFFEVRICVTDDKNKRADKTCLDKNLLQVVTSPASTRYKVPPGNIITNYKVQLPGGLTCQWCVLQWRYHSGNNWGVNADGTSCIGCGDVQEEFYNCADIQIKGTSAGATAAGGATYQVVTTPPAATQNTYTSVTTTVTYPTPANTYKYSGPAQTECCAYTAYKDLPEVKPWCSYNCPRGFCPIAMCRCGSDCTDGGQAQQAIQRVTTTTTQGFRPANVPSGQKKCKSAGAYAGSASMDTWCQTNCASNNCPPSHCSCDDKTTKFDCKVTGPQANVPGMKTWCINNCIGKTSCSPMCDCSWA